VPAYLWTYCLNIGIRVVAQVPPFDWKHAELGELRDFLKQEAAAGRFVPSNNLPL